MSKIENFLSSIYETNLFYKNIVMEHKIYNPMDITQYPILTRTTLQENRYNMFSKGYKSKYFAQQLRRQYSSGTTGTPINVYWDYQDYYASVIPLWRKRWQFYGIHTFDRYVMFTLNAFNTTSDGKTVFYIKYPENVLLVNISLIHENNSYKNLIEIINEFKPVWLYIQPFVLEKLIQAYKHFETKTPLTLKYIECVGELLSPKLKQQAVNFFKVPIANMYGSEEMNGIAYECPYHHMHILDDNVFVECLNKNGVNNYGAGEAIITSLTNKAMPLIRYNQGDQIVLSDLKRTCSCGSNSPIISLIKGRTLDSIILNEEIEINSFMLLEVIAEVNNQFSDIITNYKYVYIKSQKRLQCFIKMKSNTSSWYLNVKKTIETVFLSKITPSIDIVFEVLQMRSIQPYNKKFRVLEITD